MINKFFKRLKYTDILINHFENPKNVGSFNKMI